MAFCSSCGTKFGDGDKFCSNCGAARKEDVPASVYGPEQGDVATRKKVNVKKLVLSSVFGLVIWGGLFMVIFNSDGCSSTEGSLQAAGEPLGDFTFTPAQCKSGEHESFFGVFLLGDNSDAGGVKIVVDPRNGKFVQVEVPGSCRGDECTVVTLEPEKCSTFDVDIDRTNTYVNEIRLLDGHLNLDCKFPDGGTAKANIRFESCD